MSLNHLSGPTGSYYQPGVILGSLCIPSGVNGFTGSTSMMYIPCCANGSPTGAPGSLVTNTSASPILFDQVAGKLWVYNYHGTGSWQGATLS